MTLSPGRGILRENVQAAHFFSGSGFYPINEANSLVTS